MDRTEALHLVLKSLKTHYRYRDHDPVNEMQERSERPQAETTAEGLQTLLCDLLYGETRAENEYLSALEHPILLMQFSKRLPPKFKDILLNTQVLGTEKLSFTYLVEFVRKCLRNIE